MGSLNGEIVRLLGRLAPTAGGVDMFVSCEIGISNLITRFPISGSCNWYASIRGCSLPGDEPKILPLAKRIACSDDIPCDNNLSVAD